MSHAMYNYNLDKNGNQIKVVHNGNVVIEDDVEIGKNNIRLIQIEVVKIV